ncbi:AAA domain-containing protein [Ditylenchus destructor]|nr:AAA domain-containing protein [Ditylenchus destructor]
MSSSHRKEDSGARYKASTSSGRGSGFRGRWNSRHTPYPRNSRANEANKSTKEYGIAFEKIEQICSDLDSGKMLEGSSDLLKVVQTTAFTNRLDDPWPDVCKQIQILRVIVAVASNNHLELRNLTYDFTVKVIKSSLIEKLISQHICGDKPHIMVNPEKRTREHAILIDQLLTLLMIGLEITTWIDRLLVTVDGKMITYLKKACASYPKFLNAKTQQTLKNLEDAIQARYTAQNELNDKENKMMAIEKMGKRTFMGSRGLPPENFRNLSVIPEHKDFEEGVKAVYLRPSKETGAYDNEEHYLDIQFRLLREDLIRPLREGIHEYRRQIKAQSKSGKKRDLYVYRDVQVFEAELHKQTGQLLNYLQLRTHKNMRWNKKLIYGSLVCLSFDDFNRNLIFGVVQDRDEKMLWKGKVGLKLENPGQLDTSARYNMVESPAFFEAYKHVMRTMQNVPLNGTIPFARYFKNRPIEIAHALSSNIAELGGSIKAEHWDIDQSQFEALKYALSNELVVMQGPPGTGKTYLGLQLTRILLANQQQWNAQGNDDSDDDINDNDDAFHIPSPRTDHRPILVVCYTNHALDQFLEGISQSLKNGIIRIGGRCKNAALERFTLNKVRYEFNEARRQGPRDYEANNVRFKLTNTKNYLNRLQQQIGYFTRILSQLKTRLVSPDALRDIFGGEDCTEQQQEQVSLEQFLRKDQLMFRWLTNSRKLTDMDMSTLLVLHDWGFPEITAKNAAYDASKRFGVNSADEIARWIMLQEERGRPFSNRRPHPDIKHWPKFVDVKRLCCEGIHPIVAAEMLSSANNDINAVFAHRRHTDIPETNEENRQDDDMQTSDASNEGEMDEEFLLIARDDTADNRMLYDPAEVDDISVVKSKEDSEANKADLIENSWFEPELMKLYAPLIKTAPAMSEEEAQNKGAFFWELSLQDRWRLYQYWIKKESDSKIKILKELEEDHADNTRKLLELQSLADVDVLRCAKVIGMTTTGAAKHQAALLSLKPRIVIVEEAAEILEAHLLACLTLACEHFILIGDHQQLRPNPAVYELAKDYKLDISLFERLINNGYPYRALKRQHRMHPDISRVLMPHFYPDLEDDPSVEQLPEVMGVPENRRLLFINHSHPEENPSEMKSHSNMFEVNYSVRLAFYFTQQGYKSDQVTILCTYLDQLLELRKRAKTVFGPDHKIRIENVDNYQGEESDIIILSLVRSNNPDNKIGYLKTPNRVCVALSRAKIGFYVIGNIDFLSNRSDLWMNIRKSVEEAGALSRGTFPVKCQMHGMEQVIESLEEFDKKCPEGGCNRPCNFRRDCGHTCKKMCHALDLEHEKPCLRKCQKACSSILEQHPCKKLCHEPCGDCEVRVAKQLPCGHSIRAKCALPAEKIFCNEKCTRLLSCSHPCQLKCSDRCDSQKCRAECTAKVLKRWPLCGHEVETNCSTDVNTTLCPNPCATPLPECGHLCLGTCGKCRNGRIHLACTKNCKRILICGHECKSKCSKICPPCDRPCQTACGHSQCGQVAESGEKQKKIRKSQKTISGKNKGRTCGEPCPKCVEKCHNQCEHRKCDLPCWRPCNVAPCQEPCNKVLPCSPITNDGKRKRKRISFHQESSVSPEVDAANEKHKCIGVCGEECLGVCKICNPKEFEEIQTIFLGGEDEENARFVQLKDCGHIFAVTDIDRWVQTKIAACEDSNPENSIQENSSESASTTVSIVPIVCPKCNTPIKRSSRYISALNKRACDIDQVKCFYRGKTKEELKADLKIFHENKLEPFFKEIRDFISDSSEHCDVYTSFDSIFTQLMSVNVHNITVHWINTARNVLRIAEQLWKMFQTIREGNFSFSFDSLTPEMANATNELRLYNMLSLPANNYLYTEIDYLLKRLGGDNDIGNIAEMTLAQIAQEVDRLALLKDLMTYLGKVFNAKKDFDAENNKRLHALLEGLHGNKEFTGEHRDALKRQFNELTENHKVPSFGISEADRIEIVKAVGYDVRKWYKCSKGHLYGIGDCGEAMVQSKCPECKEVIGGSGHRLVPTSQDATHEFRNGVRPLRPIIPPEYNHFLEPENYLPL